MSDRGGTPRMVPPGKRDSPTRLYSWKEIAAYLGREERTVRRWEKAEGLPVHRLLHGKSGSVFADVAELDAWAARRTDGVRKAPQEIRAPGSRWRALGIVCGASAFILITVAWLALSRQAPPPRMGTPVPLTSDPGTELEPRLSTDGKQVAYVWDGEAHDNFDIYIRLVAGGPPVRLTTNPAHDYSPVWSPDGASIAFLRQRGPDNAAVFVMPALGGAEKMVTHFGVPSWPQWHRPGPFLTWSPNGKWLVAVGRHEPDTADHLLRISIATGETRPLTSPPRGVMGDLDPAISPDGSMLAFSRRRSWAISDLCLLPVSQDLLPSGEVRPLNTGLPWNTSPAWTPEGHTLIFSTGRMDGTHLASIGISFPAQAERLEGIGNYGWHPSLARTTDGQTRLVYTEHFESVNIWRQPLDGTSPPEQLIASAHWSYEPDYSPNGARIAFLSDRSGYVEVWVAGADGRNPQQLTDLKHLSLGAPRWSPDSRSIAFTAPGQDGSSIYVIDAPGMTPRLVPGSHRCGYLTWSRDGRAIYFSSNRRNGTQIWKIAPEGGEALQVTSTGGRVPSVSSDGDFLFYLRMVSRAGDNYLFRIPLAGGPERKVLEFVDTYSVGTAGIAFKYYRTHPKPDPPALRFFRFSTGGIETLAQPPKPLRYGVAISPDARYIIYSQSDYEVSDLMLVDAFR